jgi:hypothetical protein
LDDPVAAVRQLSQATRLFYPAWKYFASYPEEETAMNEVARACRIIENTRRTKYLPPETGEAPAATGIFNPAQFRLIYLRAVVRQVQKECLVAAVAAHRYKLTHGHFPARLQDLVPSFTSSIPHDWFSGEPLRYRLLPGDRFLVYSVGINRLDDGGNSPPSPGINQEDDPDITWPIALAPSQVEALKRLLRIPRTEEDEQ